MSTLKSFKFRLEPTTEQTVLLNKTVGCCRFVWNKMVTNFNSWNPETPSQKVTSKTLKDNPEFYWLGDVSAAALQQTQRNFEETKKQFFTSKVSNTKVFENVPFSAGWINLNTSGSTLTIRSEF